MPAAAPVDLAAPASLAWAHPVVQEWFVIKSGTATEPQEAGWPLILAGDPTLIPARTGSGKTLAAFLVAIDRLLRKASRSNSDVSHGTNRGEQLQLR